jgi:site-specific DNA-methyltransferase (adenine-specific)
MIQLLHGDCLELMKDIPDKSIDMILCDLPYGTTKNKWDSVIPFEPLWQQYNRVIKDNGAIVLFSQMPFTVDLVASNYKDFRYEWIWEKSSASGHLNANRMPMKKHENILVFYKKSPTYNPQFTEGKPYVATYSTHSSNYKKQKDNITTINDGKRYPVDIIKFHNDRGLHPTQKPVELLEYLIKTYTNDGEVVLDNCMGSGSTGVACVNLNRNFIGMELKREYFDISRERIDNARFNPQTGYD